MSTLRTITIALALLLVSGGYAQEPAKQKLLVVQTIATDGSDKRLSLLARNLTEELVVSAASLSKPNSIQVRSEAELQSMVEHVRDMSVLRPEDCRKLEECLVRMFDGEANQVLRGNLGRLGDTLFVTLKLIDLQTAGVLRAQSCAAETEEELFAALKPATAEVLGYAPTSTSTPVPEIAIPADGRVIGVVPIKGSAADEKNAALLTELLGISIREFGWGSQTTGDLISMINYATDRANLSGQPLTDAMMEIAAASGVSMLVSGHIGRIENTHLIALKLIDLRNGEVVARVLETYIGPASNLSSAMRHATGRLFGRVSSGKGGPIAIVTDVEGQYRIDHTNAEVLPQPAPKVGVDAGKHQLNITSDGFYPYYADIYLSEAEALRFRPELEPLPSILDSPLFWTIAGVVAVGTAVGIVVAVVPDGSSARSDASR
jgi:TolB-like protein